MKIIAIILASIAMLSLSGCLAAAVGAGAAGAIYVDKHYDVSVHKKQKKDTANQTKEQDLTRHN